jgi:hypothetical protein
VLQLKNAAGGEVVSIGINGTTSLSSLSVTFG